MRNKLFTLILVGLLTIGIYCFAHQQKLDSSLERRNLTTIKAFKDTKLFNYSFQDVFENVLLDQIIGKDQLIESYFKLRLTLYQPFGDQKIKLNDDVIKIDDYYIKNLPQYDADLEKTTIDRAYNIRYFAEKYPHLNFYVYKPTRIEETSLLDTANMFSYGPTYIEKYKQELGPLVTYKQMELDSIEQYQELYYKTDIHWNINGAYQGYQDIINMIQEKNPQITDPKTFTTKTCFQEKFYGATANKIAQQTAPEAICDLDITIDEPYEYYENGVLKIDQTKEKYLANEANPKYSDYDNYFGDNSYERVYKFPNNDTKVNALFFVDSYTNPNKLWIASHFDTTVFVDLRACPDRENFYLWDFFLKKYDITDVIVTQYYDNLFFNGYNFIPYN